MSSLEFSEKQKLEKLFGMGTGYVLNFTNRTFREFIHDVAGEDIYDEKYNYRSGSKANRLRAFWDKESDQVVAVVVDNLIDLAEDTSRVDENRVEECRRIADRLRQSAPVPDMEALEPNAEGRDYEALARSVKKSIEENEPEVGLDRLHTFVVRYVRVLAEERGIEVTEDKPLHSLFGELIKSFKERGEIESEMAERILKITISTMESFNHVRNQRSLAHDNSLLGYHEALFIFRHASSMVRSIRTITEEDEVEKEVFENNFSS
jgi:hypothetical protein